MTTESRELFRIALLKILGRIPSAALRLEAIRLNLVTFGFSDAAKEDIAAELAYLQDKGFISEFIKAVSPENKAWRITAAGRDFIAQNQT